MTGALVCADKISFMPMTLKTDGYAGMSLEAIKISK